MGTTRPEGDAVKTIVVALTLALLVGPVPAAGAPAGFYVAIAPYVATTHPCTYHVKGSCQAELRLVAFRYTLRSTDGTVVRTGTARSGSDGFIEWWVPENKNYVVSFSFQGREGTGTFSSFPRDATCITTIQLR
jgi:hypothetical protein